jgi:hypothetical protein
MRKGQREADELTILTIPALQSLAAGRPAPATHLNATSGPSEPNRDQLSLTGPKQPASVRLCLTPYALRLYLCTRRSLLTPPLSPHERHSGAAMSS